MATSKSQESISIPSGRISPSPTCQAAHGDAYIGYGLPAERARIYCQRSRNVLRRLQQYYATAEPARYGSIDQASLDLNEAFLADLRGYKPTATQASISAIEPPSAISAVPTFQCSRRLIPRPMRHLCISPLISTAHRSQDLVVPNPTEFEPLIDDGGDFLPMFLPVYHNIGLIKLGDSGNYSDIQAHLYAFQIIRRHSWISILVDLHLCSATTGSLAIRFETRLAACGLRATPNPSLLLSRACQWPVLPN